MKRPDDPKIESVGQTDNAAVVEFQGEQPPTVNPARLLYAAKDLADIMQEDDEQIDPKAD